MKKRVLAVAADAKDLLGMSSEAAEAIIANCQTRIELATTPTQQLGPRYPVYLDDEQLRTVKALLEQASSREADPDSPIFQILDEVREARRRNPLFTLSPATASAEAICLAPEKGAD